MHGVESVRLDLLEAERAVEAAGGVHRRKRVEPHGGVAGVAPGLDDRPGEAPAQPSPLKPGPDVEPLHLADVRLVRSKRDAARHLVSVERKEEPAGRRCVVAG